MMKKKTKKPMILVAAALCGLILPAFGGLITPEHLRCEYLENPLGIDVVEPRLSWDLGAADNQARGLRQGAYQVHVASSPELLAAGKPDLWDSGKVPSDETVGIEYAGEKLASRDRCHWRVRVWDQDGEPSAWSEPALWTMGLLEPSAWQGKWIAAPLPQPIVAPNYGFHSALERRSDQVKWVQLDLGEARSMDGLVLHPAFPVFKFRKERFAAGYLFPVRFKVEVSDHRDFAESTTIIDKTASDFANPLNRPVKSSFTPVKKRYVRLTATKLAREQTGLHGLALAELDLRFKGKNVSSHAKVTASDSIAGEAGWSPGFLCDGRIEPEGGTVKRLRPAPMLRKTFSVDRPLHHATLTATALGCYVASINGRRVSDHWFAPGWYQYDKRARYQTYDVSHLLKEGENTIGIILGDGWYRSRPAKLGYRAEWNEVYAGPYYRNDGLLRFLGQIDLVCADGTHQVVKSDLSWKGFTDGPIRKTRMYDGDQIDGRKALSGWDEPGAPSAGWVSVSVSPPPVPVELGAQMAPPIRVIDTWKPEEVRQLRPGVHVYRFPQHVAGVCRLRVEAPANTEIKLRHAQALNPDGSLFTGNLRGVEDNCDHYITTGQGLETFLPEFTYHGFQFVELSGLHDRDAVKEMTALALADDLPVAFRFECSDSRLNKLWTNVIRTYFDNTKSSTTDCSGRDERAPFKLFSTVPPHVALFDGAGFFAAQIQNILDTQTPGGAFLSNSPVLGGAGAAAMAAPNAVNLWAPWLHYADQRLIENAYPGFRRAIEAILERNPDGLWKVHPGAHVNDWLDGYMCSPPGDRARRSLWTLRKSHPYLPEELTRTAHLYWLLGMMFDMAEALGKKEDASRFAECREKVRNAFLREYVRPDGTITGGIQSSYAMPLGFGLLDHDPDLAGKAFSHLIEAIDAYQGHISTGVRATLPLLNVLSERGHHELAWKLVMQPDYPSYGFMVDQGATTVWERWDAFPDGRPQSDRSHIELPVVAGWITEKIAGIRPDPAAPGYKHFFIEPKLGGGLTWMKASYDSVRGRIESAYEIKGGKLTLRVTVPPNTTATATLPAASLETVTESGQALAKAAGVTVRDPANKLMELQAGQYEFVIPQ